MLAILKRLNDPNLLVRLACDVADRIVGQTPDPITAARWLAGARAWQESPHIIEEGYRAGWGSSIGHPIWTARERPAADCIHQVLGAAVRATKEGDNRLRDIVGRVELAAIAARYVFDTAPGGYAAEGDWQHAHLRATCCTCPPVLKASPGGGRLRTSLLAARTCMQVK